MATVPELGSSCFVRREKMTGGVQRQGKGERDAREGEVVAALVGVRVYMHGCASASASVGLGLGLLAGPVV